MDLSLTSEFDSALLNCWDEEDDDSTGGGENDATEPTSVSIGPAHQSSSNNLPRSSQDESSNKKFSNTTNASTSTIAGRVTNGENAHGGSSDHQANASSTRGEGGVAFSFARLPSFNMSLPTSSGNVSASGSAMAAPHESVAASSPNKHITTSDYAVGHHDMSNQVPTTITASHSSSDDKMQTITRPASAALDAPKPDLQCKDSSSPSPPATTMASSSVTSSAMPTLPQHHQQQQQQQQQHQASAALTAAGGGHQLQQRQQQLHHLAMTSSSSCPPHLFGGGGSVSSSTTIAAMQGGGHHSHSGPGPGGGLFGFSGTPIMAIPTHTTATATNSLGPPMEHVMAMYNPPQQQQEHPSSSLTSFQQQQNSSGHTALQGSQQQEQQQQSLHQDQQKQQQQDQGLPQPTTQTQYVIGKEANNSGAGSGGSEMQTSSSSPPPPSTQQQQHYHHQQPTLPAKSTAETSQTKQINEQQENPPPFFLFDAPCELRYNFLQSQRMHDSLPTLSTITNDSNSYHYGMAVNGFHPQLNAQVNPVLPLSVAGFGVVGDCGGGNSSTLLPNNSNSSASNSHPNLQGGGGGCSSSLSSTTTSYNPVVQLIDGRYKGKRSTAGGKERNEREQRRAQKITELIEKLRLSMVKGGWKVEMKSKYHTLTTCADYVQHLIKATKEKEKAVEQAKSDLTIRERKLEEDKALQESRSDPESVTSSLTASTAGSTPCSGSGSEKEGAGGQLDSQNNSKKRKAESGSSGSSEDQDNNTIEADVDKQIMKKVRLTKEVAKGSGGDDSTSSTDSSIGEEGGGSGPGGKNISLDKMSSSVSDITDSNRSSSDATGGGNGKTSGKKRTSPSGAYNGTGEQLSSTEDNDAGTSSGQPSSSSISSTAAVVRGGGSRERHHKHSDVVIKEKKDQKKRKHRREKTSLEQDFQLDYEEVFLTSNIPQLIATAAGRIITWNDFFLRATGLTEQEAKRLTIFSIVQADELSSLFEMVAAALRKSSSKTPPNKRHRKAILSSIDLDKESEVSSSSSKKNSNQQEWAAITLPCISFPALNSSEKLLGNSHHPNPLFMTVTLMHDVDPQKRCFHCVLTDCPGTKGDIGSVTPELLAMLFTQRSFGPEKKTSGKDKKTSSNPLKKQLIDATSESDATREDTNNMV